MMEDSTRDYMVPCSINFFLSKSQKSDYLLNEIQWSHQINDAISMMKKSIIIIATDGSSKIDAFSWIISTKTGSQIVSNTEICAKESSYLYRSELTVNVQLFFTPQLFLNMIQQ